MTTYSAHQMKESYDEGFRAGIIKGRSRQAKESNAAMRDHWKLGYDTALQDAIDAVNKFINNPEDDWDKAINNRFIQEIVNAIIRARSTGLFEG